MTLLYIPEGSFFMGAFDSGRFAYDNEKPFHEVYVDAFFLDETEVTNAMYERCVKSGICEPPADISSHTRESYYGNPDFADYPVIFVTWYQADTYCKWAGRRLPTEAEWEKAARGQDSRVYPWGSQDVSGKLANFADNGTDANWADISVDDGYQDTSPVGSYPGGKSIYGVLDMAGNVWEWVNDRYDPSFYERSVASNPTGSETGEARVIRGGSWYFQQQDIRTTFRYGHAPAYVSCSGGFRCAVSATQGQ
jgi:formylglycine-generating enzyme required for sulfatase activity